MSKSPNYSSSRSTDEIWIFLKIDLYTLGYTSCKFFIIFQVSDTKKPRITNSRSAGKVRFSWKQTCRHSIRHPRNFSMLDSFSAGFKTLKNLFLAIYILEKFSRFFKLILSSLTVHLRILCSKNFDTYFAPISAVWMLYKWNRIKSKKRKTKNWSVLGDR